MKKLTLLSALIGATMTANLAMAQSGNFYVSSELGWSYLSGKGQGSNNFSNQSRSGAKSTFSPRIAAGYDFGSYRVALDYTYLGKADKSETNTGSTLNATEWNLTNYITTNYPALAAFSDAINAVFSANQELPVDYDGYGKISGQSIGVSFFYDFDVNDSWTPYVGARASLNRVQAEVNINATSTSAALNTVLGTAGISPTISFRDSKSKILPGLALMAGTEYKLTSNLSLNAYVEYNKIFGKINLSAYNDFSGDIKVKQNISARLGLTYRF